MKTFKLNSIKPNPKNPRIIRDDAFWKLVDSIKKDPEFLDKRGIVHAAGVILGGNMRYRAIQEALKDADFRARVGVKTQTEIPAAWAQDASEWDEERRRRFVLIDNSPPGMSGEWDWDMLTNEPEYDDMPELADWGLEVPEVNFEPATAEEQGRLDKLSPKYVTCPHCGKEFDMNG